MTFDLLAFLPLFALACFTAIVLTAFVRRRGGVRGSLRAGPVHFSVEVDSGASEETPGKGSSVD